MFTLIAKLCHLLSALEAAHLPQFLEKPKSRQCLLATFRQSKDTLWLPRLFIVPELPSIWIHNLFPLAAQGIHHQALTGTLPCPSQQWL